MCSGVSNLCSFSRNRWLGTSPAGRSPVSANHCSWFGRAGMRLPPNSGMRSVFCHVDVKIQKRRWGLSQSPVSSRLFFVCLGTDVLFGQDLAHGTACLMEPRSLWMLLLLSIRRGGKVVHLSVKIGSDERKSGHWHRP